MKRIIPYVSLLFLALSAVTLIGYQLKVTGFLILIIGGVFLLLSPLKIRKELNIVFATAAILGLAPLNTNLSLYHIVSLTTFLTLTSILTYTLATIEFKKHNPLLMLFSLVKQTREQKWIGALIIFTTIASYFALPIYFKQTASYLNWSFDLTPISLIMLFLSLALVGLWEEIFFKSNILKILENHFSFFLANSLQALFAASFLYAIGFRSYGFFLAFIFAFIQGYIYHRSTIWHVIFLHVCLDIIVFLILVQLHYPRLWPHLMMTG